MTSISKCRCGGLKWLISYFISNSCLRSSRAFFVSANNLSLISPAPLKLIVSPIEFLADF